VTNVEEYLSLLEASPFLYEARKWGEVLYMDGGEAAERARQLAKLAKEYYRDYVEKAKERQVITEQTAKTILELMPTRHNLIHRYRRLDYRKLWSDADKAIQAIPSLTREVKDHLRKTIDEAEKNTLKLEA